jgi:general secretion pathway protein J
MRRRSSGFTLVELLVALSILALMSLLAWRGLDGVIRGRDAARVQTERITALNSMMEQMAIDLRNVTDQSGAPIRLITATETGLRGMQVRRAWTGPDGVNRDILVVWQLDADNRWTRASFAVNAKGDAQAALQASQPMLQSTKLDIRLFAQARWWNFSEWPLPWNNGVAPQRVDGVALEMTLPEGPVSRTFLVGGA